MGSISGLRQAMATLVAYNNTALQLAKESRVLSAEGVKNSNAAIGAAELTEINYKAVNDVYLKTLAKDVSTFTGQQTQDLFAVANQCPLLGGNAVFQARSIYYLIDPEQDFDDPTLCLQHGLITKSRNVPTTNTLSMVPNPANDQATLVLTEPLEEGGLLKFYDALGAEVYSVRIPADQQRTVVNTARLSTGIYQFRVFSDKTELGSGKLSIAR